MVNPCEFVTHADSYFPRSYHHGCHCSMFGVFDLPNKFPSTVEHLCCTLTSFDSETFAKFQNIKSVTMNHDWPMESLEGIAHLLKDCVLPGLVRCRHLEEFTLPRAIVLAWSTLKHSRKQLAALGSNFCFPGVHRLNLGDFYGRLSFTVPGLAIDADRLLPSFLRMFPNLQVLMIHSVPYFHDFPFLPDVEKLLPGLRKLVVVNYEHYCYDSLYRRRPEEWKWLPRTQNIEVLLLGGENIFVNDDDKPIDRLLGSLAQNHSLRYVLLMENRDHPSHYPAIEDIAYVADSWCRRPWRCILIWIYDSDIVYGAIRDHPSPYSPSHSGRHFTCIEMRCVQFCHDFPDLYEMFSKELIGEQVINN